MRNITEIEQTSLKNLERAIYKIVNRKVTIETINNALGCTFG